MLSELKTYQENTLSLQLEEKPFADELIQRAINALDFVALKFLLNNDIPYSHSIENGLYKIYMKYELDDLKIEKEKFYSLVEVADCQLRKLQAINVRANREQENFNWQEIDEWLEKECDESIKKSVEIFGNEYIEGPRSLPDRKNKCLVVSKENKKIRDNYVDRLEREARRLWQNEYRIYCSETIEYLPEEKDPFEYFRDLAGKNRSHILAEGRQNEDQYNKSSESVQTEENKLKAAYFTRKEEAKKLLQQNKTIANYYRWYKERYDKPASEEATNEFIEKLTWLKISPDWRDRKNNTLYP